LNRCILLCLINLVQKLVQREKNCHCSFIRPGVNFINILLTNFSYKGHFGSFFYVHVTREKLPKRHSYEKFVRKMLMKLTTEEQNMKEKICQIDKPVHWNDFRRDIPCSSVWSWLILPAEIPEQPAERSHRCVAASDHACADRIGHGSDGKLPDHLKQNTTVTLWSHYRYKGASLSILYYPQK